MDALSLVLFAVLSDAVNDDNPCPAIQRLPLPIVFAASPHGRSVWITCTFSASRATSLPLATVKASGRYLGSFDTAEQATLGSLR